MDETGQSEWHYVGNYGQLGPLTLDNLSELIADCVVERDTFVWRPGMPDWAPAGSVPQLIPLFKLDTQPPPPPVPGSRMGAPIASAGPSPLAPSTPVPQSPMRIESGYTAPLTPYGTQTWNPALYSVPKSDKNRVMAALLNVVPGVGRMYLGHVAIGVLQLITSMCGFGLLWSWADGIYILAGGLRHDGYGRELAD
ncbi:MAG: DUF4339 domain-containing protein [Armatimonadetes bacterium]|nr:DUF4339 domain-containing protein [Armatimonadota bacterium]MBS1711636.1 DUF4339 domain-containing protein [Armatimonadota bacterium]MBX3109809.1 DUF4339 domain-containing protein [Fimbriimonadaceae bacterium]